MSEIYAPAISPEGFTVDDESVAITESFVVDGTTYYRGSLLYAPNYELVESPSSSGFGIWTATAKGGSQLTATVNPPGAGEITVEMSGVLYSLSSQTVYVYYRGHDRLVEPSESLGQVRLDALGLLDAAAERVVRRCVAYQAQSFSGVAVSLLEATTGSITIRIGKDVAGGEPSTNETIVIGSGQAGASSTFSSALNYAASEHITLSVLANTAGAVDLHVVLQRG